jgi:acetyl-CoA acetyltransferase
VTDIAEHRVVISGVGQSAVGRQLETPGLQLTHDAILAAVEDAGLSLADIDGLSSTFGLNYTPGASDPDPGDIAAGLGLDLTWSANEGNAVHAVAAGACRHAVVYRTVKEGSKARAAGGRPGVGMDTMAVASGRFARYLPVGALSAANWFALDMSRHMHLYGTTREQLGWVAVTQRAHAALNPLAIYTDPLTLEDYMGAPMISSPLGLFDCDVPVDASTAFVYSHADAVADLRDPVRIEAQGSANREGQARVATDMWSRTSLKPSDVDVVQMYDGFSHFVLFGLEDLGFCGQGESGAFVEGGKRISLGGELPLNTWGGQLSAGRLHLGVGHLAEAVHQVRGECGERQVIGAEVALSGFVLRGSTGTLVTKAGTGTLLTKVR